MGYQPYFLFFQKLKSFSNIIICFHYYSSLNKVRLTNAQRDYKKKKPLFYIPLSSDNIWANISNLGVCLLPRVHASTLKEQKKLRISIMCTGFFFCKRRTMKINIFSLKHVINQIFNPFKSFFFAWNIIHQWYEHTDYNIYFSILVPRFCVLCEIIFNLY